MELRVALRLMLGVLVADVVREGEEERVLVRVGLGDRVAVALGDGQSVGTLSSHCPLLSSSKPEEQPLTRPVTLKLRAVSSIDATT